MDVVPEHQTPATRPRYAYLPPIQPYGALNVAVGDVITPVPQSNGIRQGSPDSPDLFGAIIAKDLQAALAKAPTQPPDPQGRPPTPQSGGIFP